MAGTDEMFTLSDQQSSINIENLRSLVRSYIDRHQYSSAEFWADKAVSLSNGDLQDLYWYAHTLYLTGQHHRASHLLKMHQMERKFLAGRYLAARCHFASQEYQEALDVLDQTDSTILGLSKSSTRLSEETHPNIPTDRMSSCMNLLRGQVYESMDNRNLAAECFREALREDVYCYEAFNSLVNHQMLTAQEERELLESLPLAKQCPEEEIELVSFLYENKLKKYSRPSELTTPSSLQTLNNSLDITVNLGERYYYNCDFRECYRITSKVLEQDPFNSQCLPLHVAVLVELKKANALFHLAHKLVDMYPNKAVAWFAVGCYYLLVGKNDPARRYLSKATSLDRVYGPAWLAFGHSFAAEKEHDQAMAAYFTASHLMKGCHLPVLYIGLEYGLTNNSKLAERFFSQALSIAPEDPFVLHEMGVIAFQNQDYEQAMKYFKSALEKVQVVARDVMLEKWEPLLNNLGHVCRKLQRYEDSLEYHQQALILCPQSPSTLSAIGYVHALTGNYSDAVDYFHKALGLNRDDTFATSMLGRSIEKLMDEVTPCEELPDPLPPFTYAGKLDISEVPANDSEDRGLDDESSIQTEGEITMGDASGVALDVDMDES